MFVLFRRAAARASWVVGSAWAFVIALAFFVVMLAVGAAFGFGDRWLAVLSAALSSVTFLLVFLLQYRENRDTAAIQIKLNELLRAVEGARERDFLDLEHKAEEEQEHVYRQLREQVAETK